MKIIRNISIVLLLLLMAGFALPSPGLAQSPVALATAQVATGDSAGTCYTYQASRMTIFFDTTGSTAISVDVLCYDGATWFTLSGTGLPITTIGTGSRSIDTIACVNLKLNVGTCTSCTLTATCQKWKAN